jgi:hypothetical protein
VNNLPKPFDLPLAEGDEVVYYTGCRATRVVVHTVGYRTFFHQNEKGKYKQLVINRIAEVRRDGVLVAANPEHT